MTYLAEIPPSQTDFANNTPVKVLVPHKAPVIFVFLGTQTDPAIITVDPPTHLTEQVKPNPKTLTVPPGANVRYVVMDLDEYVGTDGYVRLDVASASALTYSVYVLPKQAPIKAILK